MRRVYALVSLFLLVWTTNAKSFAQALGTPAPASAMTVSISQAKDLSIATGSSVEFNFTSIASLENGIENENAVSLIYKANKPWVLSIRANSPTFSGSAPTPMPAAVVQYKLNGSSNYVTLTAFDVAVLGTDGSRGSSSINIDYKVSPGFLYDPANDYALTITYTLSDQ